MEKVYVASVVHTSTSSKVHPYVVCATVLAIRYWAGRQGYSVHPSDYNMDVHVYGPDMYHIVFQLTDVHTAT